MAQQTKRKRRRKRRGTQGGTIDRGRGRPRSRDQAKAQARRRNQDRRDMPPTWRTAIYRGLFGGAIFLVLAMLLLRQPVGGAIALTVVMVGMYIPLGYYVDRFMYRRRMSQRLKQKQEREERAGR